MEALVFFINFFASAFRTRAVLLVENLALRHQLCVYMRSVNRPRVKAADRAFWSLLARWWDGWREALVFVTPDTVLRWQRKRFREHWTKLSRAEFSAFDWRSKAVVPFSKKIRCQV